MSAFDLAHVIAALTAYQTETNPALVKQKSRDFYWYSPVLKRQLDQVTGDIVVMPADEAELVEILAIAHRLGCPVTPRGTGTGNYGQAMPLSGGIVLDLSRMNRVKEIVPGRVTVEAGALVHDICEETRRHSRQELRLWPSTAKTATIGGFVAGGSGGVGSIAWGGLRDAGNILRARVVTCEEQPRILELTGDDIAKVSHAYGTTGIITELDMPLTAAVDWVDVLIAFDTLSAAVRFADRAGHMDGIEKKELGVVGAPVPHQYFVRHRKFLAEGDHLVVAMIAPTSMAGFVTAAAHAGGRVVFRQDMAAAEELKGLPPAYELMWNHTTLRALRVDPATTYLQILFPHPNSVALVETTAVTFGDEVPVHLEFARLDGNLICFGLHLVRFTSEERLEEIMRRFEAEGCPVFNAHRYTLEEGGMKQTDAVQFAFKTQTDPKGLLNPGKMIAWEDPDFDFSTGGTWLFRSLAQQQETTRNESAGAVLPSR